MNRSRLILCALALALPGCGPGRTPPPPPPPSPGPTVSGLPKPKLAVAADGFPAGHATPEGAACDLARAFIAGDAALFTATCLPAYGGPDVQDRYKEFLHGVIESFLKLHALSLDPATDNPKSIAAVFAARSLSGNGPASYAYAAFGFRDVKFVDVDAVLNDGEHALNRTLVIQTKDGQWFVHPAPDISPLLAVGLDDETPSTRSFTDVYDLGR